MTTFNPSMQHPTVWQRILQSIARTVQRATDAATRAHRERRLMRELAKLDDHTLRDIGLHRTEIGSMVAEVIGVAPTTRRRAMHTPARREA